MNLKDIRAIIGQLVEEKGISEKDVLETIEEAFASAYRKEYGKKNQKIKTKFNLKTGELQFWQIKLVIDKDAILTEQELQEKIEIPEDKVRFNPERHILIEEAKKIDSSIKIGEELNIPMEAKKDYGRIAAQTAKQVILQKLREAEKETLFAEYKSREGEIISGTVQRIERNSVFFDIGKVLGVLAQEEQIPGEFYKLNQRFKLYILRVEKSPKGPLIFLSRVFPKFISKLFEVEVPEISTGQVVIKAIAREPGSRTKMAVQSTDKDIDPIGSVVGQRGSRVLAVISELGGEKIDIIEADDNIERFIRNSLSPAKVVEVKILPQNKALCLLPEDQLSLAIGKNGQNVRLAAKLTGWKIDVKSIEEMAKVKKETEEVKVKKVKKATKIKKGAKAVKEKKITKTTKTKKATKIKKAPKAK